MDKRQSFIEMRAELTAAYVTELRNVQILLRDGVTRIENGSASIELSEPRPLAADGEAGQTFADEFSDIVCCALERYERNLRKEIERLGLNPPTESAPQSGDTKFHAGLANSH